MKNSGITWNEATLDKFIENPDAVVQTTPRSFLKTASASSRISAPRSAPCQLDVACALRASLRVNSVQFGITSQETERLVKYRSVWMRTAALATGQSGIRSLGLASRLTQ